MTSFLSIIWVYNNFKAICSFSSHSEPLLNLVQRKAVGNHIADDNPAVFYDDNQLICDFANDPEF